VYTPPVTGTLGVLATALSVWLAAGMLLSWGYLPGRWRRALALLVSLAGLVFLILAVNTEGLRESPAVAVYLLGPAYVTGQASASASLPYYVLTGICLLLGSVGLAAGDAFAHAVSRRWFSTALCLSIAMSLTRFLLEKVASPAWWTQMFGVTWLPPVVGALFWLRLRADGKGIGALIGSLLLYGVMVRTVVVALYVVATTWRLGSHYDLSALVRVRNPFTGHVYEFASGSLAQVVNLAVIPQLLIWPFYTVFSGLIGAWIAWLITYAWPGPPEHSVRTQVRMAPVHDR
jgi:hypothetical protein